MGKIDAIRSLFFGSSNHWRAIKNMHTYLESDEVVDFIQVRAFFADVFCAKVIGELSLKASIHLVLCVSICFERFAPNICLKTKSQFQILVALLGKIFRFRGGESTRELDRILDSLRATNAFLIFCDNSQALTLAKTFVEYSDVGADFAVHMMANAERWTSEMTEIVIANMNRSCFSMGLRNLSHARQQFLVVEIMKVTQRRDALNVITKLASIFDVDMISMFENMKMEIISENDTERQFTVRCCSAILKSLKNGIDQDSYQEFLKFLLRRHEDRVTEIREMIVDLCFFLLDSPISDKLNLLSIIKSRLSDPSAKVRRMCWKQKLPIDYDYTTYVRDKDMNIVKMAFDFWVDDFLNPESDYRDITPLLVVYHERSKILALLKLKEILHSRSLVDITEYLDRHTCVRFVNMIAEILSLQKHMESLICIFESIAPRYQTMINIELWRKYLPSQVIWKLWMRRDIEKLRAKVDDSFLQELLAVNVDLPLDPEVMVERSSTFVIKAFCQGVPSLFSSYCRELLRTTTLTSAQISALVGIYGHLDEKVILKKLVSLNTDDSLSAFSRLSEKAIDSGIRIRAKMLGPWCYQVEIGEEGMKVDISTRGEGVKYNFIQSFLDSSLIPKDVFSTKRVNNMAPSVLKAVQRLSCVARNRESILFNMKVIEARNDHYVPSSVMCLMICDELRLKQIEQIACHINDKDVLVGRDTISRVSRCKTYRATIFLCRLWTFSRGDLAVSKAIEQQVETIKTQEQDCTKILTYLSNNFSHNTESDAEVIGLVLSQIGKPLAGRILQKIYTTPAFNTIVQKLLKPNYSGSKQQRNQSDAK